MINIYIFFILAIAIFIFLIISSNNYIRITSIKLLYSRLLAFKAINTQKIGSGLFLYFKTNIKNFLIFFLTIIITLCLIYIGYFKQNLFLLLIKHFYILLLLLIFLSFFIYFFYNDPIDHIKKNEQFETFEAIESHNILLDISEVHYDTKMRSLKYVMH